MKSHSLMDALKGITNARAFTTLFATLCASGLLMAGFASVGMHFMANGSMGMSKFILFFGMFVTALVTMTGVSATGFLLSDLVRKQVQRTISAALLVALATIHRFVGIALVTFVAWVVTIIAIAVLLFVCKIPALGPLLFTVVFPVSALFVGLLWAATMMVLGLSGPAIWWGNPMMRALAVLLSITRHRLLQVSIQTLLLWVMAAIVSAIVSTIIFTGLGTTSSLSVAIIGTGLNAGQLMGSLMSSFGMGEGYGMGGESQGAGYMYAALFGFGLLSAICFVIPMLVMMTGNCTIFAEASDGLAVDDAEKAIQGVVDSAREKAEEARRKLEESRQQLSQAAANASQPQATPASNACPACHVTLAAGDVFCCNCGHRLA